MGTINRFIKIVIIDMGYVVISSMLFGSPLSGAEMVRKNELRAPITDPVNVEIRLAQSELTILQATALSSAEKDAIINASAAGWGTRLIVVSILDAYQQKKLAKESESLASDIREVLVGVDYRPSLIQRFEGGVNPVILPIIGDVRYSSSDVISEMVDGSVTNQTNLLAVDCSYALTGDFKALHVEMRAVLWDRDVDIYQTKGFEKKIREVAKYYQDFAYEITISELATAKTRNQRAAQWADLGKEKLGSMILTGLITLVDAMEYDLRCPEHEENLGKVKYFMPNGAPAVAQVVKEIGTQRWTRTSVGTLLVLDQE